MDENNPAPQPVKNEQNTQKATGAYRYMQPYKTKRQIAVDNFLGGLFWSFGSFIGLALIALFVGYLISQIDLVPIVGTWIAQVMQDATSRLELPIQPR